MIIADAAARRAETGIEPLGAAAILRQHPFSQPAKTKKSHAPLVHAASKRVRTEMRIAYRWFVRAFREAADYLRAGDRLARFPRGSFPTGLPLSERGGWRSARRRRHRPLVNPKEDRPKFLPAAPPADDRCSDASARRFEYLVRFDPEVISAEKSAATRSAGRRFRPRAVVWPSFASRGSVFAPKRLAPIPGSDSYRRLLSVGSRLQVSSGQGGTYSIRTYSRHLFPGSLFHLFPHLIQSLVE